MARQVSHPNVCRVYDIDEEDGHTFLSMFNQILNVVPLTVDLSRPHAGVSTLALLIVAGMAVYAFSISRAGEGMFRRLLPPV